MSISKRLFLTILLPVVIAFLLLGLVLYFSSAQMNNATKQGAIFDAVANGTFTLTLLTNDYLLQSGERVLDQWDIQYALLADLLSEAETEDATSQALIDTIARSHVEIELLFVELVEHVEENEASGINNSDQDDIEIFLVAQIVSKAQTMVESSSRIQELNRANLDRIHRRTNVFLLVISSAIVIPIIGVITRTARMLIRNIGKLHAGSKMLTSGNLDYVVEINSQDELGALATAFNEMISARKQAEDKLRSYGSKLEKSNQEFRESEENLGERVKELNCLYGISQLMENEGFSMGEILQEVVEIIPLGWHYPELTCARIALRNDEYKTANFEETKWKQGADIVVNMEKIGVVEVCYLEEMPELDEGPFLKEARHLIDAIAETLGNEIDRQEKEEQIKRQVERVAALREIDAAIIGSLDLRLTLDIVLNQVVSQLVVDAAAILLLGPNQNLTYAAHNGFKSDVMVKTANIRLGSSYAGLSALELRFVSLDDLDESQVPGEFSELLTSENFSSYFAAPLASKGQTLGVLEVYSRSQLSPDKDWKDFFETIAQQAAIAIDSVQLFDGLRKSKADLEVAYEATLAGLGKAIDLRDHDTEGHSQRVTDMTLDLAIAIGVAQRELINIGRGALLHDIGKLSVPDAILHKPGKLSDNEWEIMHKHPVFAFEMLSQIAFLEPAMDIPYCHHEKWDGTGYPRGLKGKEIPLAARIFAIVDVWDALRSDRPYRKAWSTEKTLQYIRDQSGKHFDPEVVDAFMRLPKN